MENEKIFSAKETAEISHAEKLKHCEDAFDTIAMQIETAAALRKKVEESKSTISMEQVEENEAFIKDQLEEWKKDFPDLWEEVERDAPERRDWTANARAVFSAIDKTIKKATDGEI